MSGYGLRSVGVLGVIWVALAFAGALVWAAAGDAGAATKPGDNRVNMNEIQIIKTHNGYHREISEQEQDAYDALINTPGDYDEFLAYSHASIPQQLGGQDVRGVELDLFPDPQGGLYRHPLARKEAGLGPLEDPAWSEPGIKVFHIADADYNTTCVKFTTCLEQVESWSDDNPNHVAIFVQLELKRSEARFESKGGVVSPPWDAARLDELDAEIRSVFGEEDLVTPDDVRRPGLTLNESVLRHGWPTLEEARGKVMFVFDNSSATPTYSQGRPNLEGRPVFTNSTPGQTHAAFRLLNDPMASFSQIQDLVRQGYVVRDLPLSTVRSGDTTMLRRALDSGAQLVSTDFPAVGMAARYGTDYVAQLPGGGPARCNPVNAPKGCESDELEPAGRK